MSQFRRYVKPSLRRWAGVGAAVLLAGCGGGSGGGGTSVEAGATPGGATACVAATSLLAAAESYVPAPVALKSSSLDNRTATRRVAVPRTVSLPVWVGSRAARVLPNGVRQLGVARGVAPTHSVAATASLLQWQPVDGGGTVAALRFQSAAAHGIRLGLVVDALPSAAVLRLYAPDGRAVAEVQGSEVLATLQRNQDAGDTGVAAHTYWTPGVDSDDVTLEITLPPGTEPAAVRMAVPSLSHFVESPHTAVKVGVNVLKVGEAGVCEVDVACNASYGTESNAVARMIFVDAGSSYLCTGTLVNDATSSGTPYFLSANHCISSQSIASTVTTQWFYRASACNNGTLNAQTKVLTGGATLLYASAGTDTAFMRLNAAPPAGVVYAGWNASLPAIGAAAAGLHHPHGDLQKLSQGAVRGFQRCTPATSGDYGCLEATADTAKHLAVAWTSGITEAGSSGSGLFTTLNGKHYLVGQLTGGSSSCTVGGGVDYYGRLDVAYTAALGQWLGAAPATGACP